MATKMKPRQRRILQALTDLGGQATQREIANVTGLSVNGVSQSLGALQAQGKVHMTEWTKKDATWVVWTSESPADSENGDAACLP